jgi:putative endonuclease
VLQQAFQKGLCFSDVREYGPLHASSLSPRSRRKRRGDLDEILEIEHQGLLSRLAAHFIRPDASPQTNPKSANRKKGDAGELVAYDFLRGNGYRIVARKYKRRSGEIDLIGWDKDVLTFIEVKFRAHLEHGRPEEAVDFRKQKQISRVAKEYRITHRLHDINYRFDIVSIQGSGPDRQRVIKTHSRRRFERGLQTRNSLA